MGSRRASRWGAALLVAGVAAVWTSACGGGGGSSTQASLPAGCQQVAKPPPKHVSLSPPGATVSPGHKLAATVDTSCGTFSIALDPTRSPKTVSSFAYLVHKGVYDGTIFHRIVPGFVIQGGDPTQSGSGGPGYSVTEPPPKNSRYVRGTVAMAKTAIEPSGRSGSQFFIVTATDAGLPPQYAILGKVSSGQDVVSRIASLGDPTSGQTGTPLATVVIRHISISRG
jgi:peptidyl-prolyl cis-trans isomerase B (cyclophilin B)